jgi:2-alkyl-3-oxoalkanoate reductase
MLVDFHAPILVTGGAGFVGSRVVANLLNRGFTRVRCFTRRPPERIRAEVSATAHPQIEWIHANLHSMEDCLRAARDVQVIFHLAAGTGEKSYADAFLNSVVTTRNLLEAALATGALKRFVSVSSFAVYSNRNKPRRNELDESCPIAQGAERWRDPYTYAKLKQDELVKEYGRVHGLPYVLLRPGAVYGPGKRSISARVGIGSFGIFLHLGGGNRVPFTYVENCAEAVVLAGLTEGINGETFNVVDDDLPSSREFLSRYKRQVRRFRSIYLPHFVSYLLCYAWEKYSAFSQGQLPPAFHRAAWHAYWKKTHYRNDKLKQRLGWTQRISTADGLNAYFTDCRKGPISA